MKAGSKFSRVVLIIGLLSSATLMFETALTRFLAIAQFYHFAFLVVSLALLGFGASGTLLGVYPKIKELPLEKTLSWVSIGFVLSIWVTYGVINWLPFDSYSIAWEGRQIILFILYYFSLSLPFLVSGLGLGTALALVDEKHNLIYAANLVGSGLGVILAPTILALSGIVGVILLVVLLGIGCWIFMNFDRIRSKIAWSAIGLGLIFTLISWITLFILNIQGRSPLGIQISPYKGLSYARQYPNAESVFGKWNGFSRIDVMANAGTRRFPGLSYVYSGNIPTQHGLAVDGGVLQPITLTKAADFSIGQWLPEWWAFSVKNTPDVLVLDPGAGFGILQAIEGNSGSVTTVIENRLILESVREVSPEFSVFDHPDVELRIGNPRTILQTDDDFYDLVFIPLTDSYQPVTNGVYSISENYTLTEEGIQASLNRLSGSGIFITSRWMQNPPSEGLRMVSTILESMEDLNIDNPADSFVIYRGIQTITIAVKPDGWEESELTSLREFLERCRFDLVWAPDFEIDELNRWNQLPEPIYHQTIKELFLTSDRHLFYESYPFNITPPIDNQPFFFHFFTWHQTPQIFRTMGKTWQPFGGSGFFLLIFLLVLVIFLSTIMILLPLIGNKRNRPINTKPGKTWVLIYFGLIGSGFMFLEIPLISLWRLFLNSPIFAFSLIVGVLLLSSGLGSMAVDQPWIQKNYYYLLFFFLGTGFIFFCTVYKELILSWPIWIRYLVPCFGLFPLGFLMGFFFPTGIGWIKTSYPGLVPWAWAVNGSTSVIASVITAILSLQGGYPIVLMLGGLFYLGAWIIYRYRIV